MIKNRDITSAIILDTRKAKLDGTFPIKLRITFKRTQKYYTLKTSLSPEDFEKCFEKNPKKEFKDYSTIFKKVENEAIDIINDISEFTFEKFDERFLDKTVDKKSVFEAYENYMAKLKINGQIGTASNYNTSLNSLKEFHKKKNLFFENITSEFLSNYEKYMLNLNKSYTTI